MKIIAAKLTGTGLMQAACSMTTGGKNAKMVTLDDIYDNEHSPMRTQIFWIQMFGIPSFVSVHLRTHNVGVTHFVQSKRDDRGGNGQEGRLTPVDHGMLINSQALINMSRKRLCLNAHDLTVKTWEYLKEEIRNIDSDLAKYMVKECQYRNECHEGKRSCGWWEENELIPLINKLQAMTTLSHGYDAMMKDLGVTNEN